MGLLEDAKNFVTEKVADMPMPEAAIKDVDVQGVGLNGMTYLVKISVKNPYGVSIPIGEITYSVKSAEREVVAGSIPDPGSIKANDTTELEVTVKLPHNALVSLARDVAADWDIDYILDMGLIVDLPALGNITLPMSYKGEMKLPSFSDMFWGKSEAEPPSTSSAAETKDKTKDETKEEK